MGPQLIVKKTTKKQTAEALKMEVFILYLIPFSTANSIPKKKKKN